MCTGSALGSDCSVPFTGGSVHRQSSLSTLVFFALACATPAQVATPAEHLGRPVGRDFELADWNEVRGYHERLAAESEHALYRVCGTSTEGRAFPITVISSAANLARLDRLRALAARIADPRGLSDDEKREAVREGVPILFVSLGMHSTETSPPQFGMELAHRLATSDEEPYASAREELVVVLIPCTNPDGLDHVVSWYRETVGTPHEATGLLKLYQLYSGHDNNRDWFALTQNETRIVTRLLYSEWRPQVYWDVHQQGRSRERFFVPPFRDPLNPNLDPGIIAGIGALGSRALWDMTREGFTGISTGVSYDMWWNGGNRNVPVRHNIIGLLTEAASCDLASPVFLSVDDLRAPRGLGHYAPSNRFPEPWPGGWWRIRDIIDYEHAFARSLLASLAREPERWLQNALEAAERTIAAGRDEAPRGWIVPSSNADVGAVRRLVDVLLLSGAELFVATEELAVDGRRWPAGSLVIPRDQPYGAHVQDLFEVQRYPDGDSPYDVAGWTLPLLFGVHRVEVVQPWEGPTRPVDDLATALAGFDGGADPDRELANSDAWRERFRRLAAGEATGLASPDGGELAPRIGLYAPWSGSMDEGWLRWVFDEFDVPYVRVRNEMIRAGRLDELVDVLVLPSLSARSLDAGRTPGSVPSEYARGLDPEGAVAIEEFVRAGGRLVATGRSSDWAIDLFELPLVDVTDADDFACPGSVLRAVPARERLAEVLPPSVAIFFSRSAAWRIADDAELDELGLSDPTPAEDLTELLRLAPTRVLLSGWIRSPETVEGASVWVRADHGAGAIHLFGFSPHYRGWSHQAFQLLFHALWGTV